MEYHQKTFSVPEIFRFHTPWAAVLVLGWRNLRQKRMCETSISRACCLQMTLLCGASQRMAFKASWTTFLRLVWTPSIHSVQRRWERMPRNQHPQLRTGDRVWVHIAGINRHWQLLLGTRAEKNSSEQLPLYSWSCQREHACTTTIWARYESKSLQTSTLSFMAVNPWLSTPNRRRYSFSFNLRCSRLFVVVIVVCLSILSFLKGEDVNHLSFPARWNPKHAHSTPGNGTSRWLGYVLRVQDSVWWTCLR